MKRECLHPEEIPTEADVKIGMTWAQRLELIPIVIFSVALACMVLVMPAWLAYGEGKLAAWYDQSQVHSDLVGCQLELRDAE